MANILPKNPQDRQALVLRLAKAPTGGTVTYKVNGESRKLVEVPARRSEHRATNH